MLNNHPVLNFLVLNNHLNCQRLKGDTDQQLNSSQWTNQSRFKLQQSFQPRRTSKYLWTALYIIFASLAYPHPRREGRWGHGKVNFRTDSQCCKWVVSLDPWVELEREKPQSGHGGKPGILEKLPAPRETRKMSLDQFVSSLLPGERTNGYLTLLRSGFQSLRPASNDVPLFPLSSFSFLFSSFPFFPFTLPTAFRPRPAAVDVSSTAITGPPTWGKVMGAASHAGNPPLTSSPTRLDTRFRGAVSERINEGFVSVRRVWSNLRESQVSGDLVNENGCRDLKGYFETLKLEVRDGWKWFWLIWAKVRRMWGSLIGWRFCMGICALSRACAEFNYDYCIIVIAEMFGSKMTRGMSKNGASYNWYLIFGEIFRHLTVRFCKWNISQLILKE